MRSFVAIEIDRAIKENLVGIKLRSRVSGRNIRWLQPGSIHLTLKFLGEIDPAAVPVVTKAIEFASRDITPFRLEVAGVGFFPNRGRPRVCWAGIHENEGKLCALQEQCEQAFSGIGFDCETRAFRPHLTLARFKDKADGVSLNPDEENELFGTQTVNNVVLFKSRLLPQGAQYTPLSVVTLKEQEQ